MGETHAELSLTSLITRKSVVVRALVDTGSSSLILTPLVAALLGYDPEELSVGRVHVADGRSVEAPRIEGIRIEYCGHRCTTDAFVLPGDECLLGFIAMEALDVIVDPLQQRLVIAPADRTYVRLRFAL